MRRTPRTERRFIAGIVAATCTASLVAVLAGGSSASPPRASETLTPLETITLPAFTDRSVTTQTTFELGKTYSFVFTGTQSYTERCIDGTHALHEDDTFFNFGACGFRSPGGADPIYVNGHYPTYLGGGDGAGPYDGTSHRYVLLLTKNFLVSGKFTFTNRVKSAPTPDAAGSFTIKIYEVGKAVCKVGFSFTAHGVPHGRTVVAVRVGGAGTISFPPSASSSAPACNSELDHGSPSPGTAIFHIDVFDRHRFPGLPELKMTIKPDARASTYLPAGRGGQVALLLDGKVTASNDPKCPVGESAVVGIIDGFARSPNVVKFSLESADRGERSDRSCNLEIETLRSLDPHRVAVTIRAPKPAAN